MGLSESCLKRGQEQGMKADSRNYCCFYRTIFGKETQEVPSPTREDILRGTSIKLEVERQKPDNEVC